MDCGNCGHGKHQVYSDHDECTVGDCQCDTYAPSYPPAIKEEMEFLNREFEQLVAELSHESKSLEFFSADSSRRIVRDAFMRGWSLGRMWEEQEALKKADAEKVER